MSYDLAVWKWKHPVAQNDPLSVYRLISEYERPHASLVRFDAQPFLAALRGRFVLDGDEPEIIVEVVDFAGAKANYILLDCSYSLTRRLTDIIDITLVTGLVLFDPQSVALNGKKWEPATVPVPPSWQFVFERTNCKKMYDPSATLIKHEITRQRGGVVILQRLDDSFLQLAGYGVASFFEHFDALSGELRRAYSDNPSFKTVDGTTADVLGHRIPLQHDEWIDRDATVPIFQAFASGTAMPEHFSWRIIGKKKGGAVVMLKT